MIPARVRGLLLSDAIPRTREMHGDRTQNRVLVPDRDLICRQSHDRAAAFLDAVIRGFGTIGCIHRSVSFFGWCCVLYWLGRTGGAGEELYGKAPRRSLIDRHLTPPAKRLWRDLREAPTDQISVRSFSQLNDVIRHRSVDRRRATSCHNSFRSPQHPLGVPPHAAA